MEPHEVLGVPRDAPSEQVRRAYRRLAFRHHPDRDRSPGSQGRFQEIRVAYEALVAARTPRVIDHGPSVAEILACARAVIFHACAEREGALLAGEDVVLDVAGVRVTMTVVR